MCYFRYFSYKNINNFAYSIRLVILTIASIQDSVSDSSRGSDLSNWSTNPPSLDKFSSPKLKKALRTTNAYFYWVTREQGSFDWFKGVMNEVADLDQRVFIFTEYLFTLLRLPLEEFLAFLPIS